MPLRMQAVKGLPWHKTIWKWEVMCGSILYSALWMEKKIGVQTRLFAAFSGGILLQCVTATANLESPVCSLITRLNWHSVSLQTAERIADEGRRWFRGWDHANLLALYSCAALRMSKRTSILQLSFWLGHTGRNVTNSDGLNESWAIRATPQRRMHREFWRLVISSSSFSASAYLQDGDIERCRVNSKRYNHYHYNGLLSVLGA